MDFLLFQFGLCTFKYDDTDEKYVIIPRFLSWIYEVILKGYVDVQLIFFTDI